MAAFTVAAARAELARRELDRRRAVRDPLFLASHMVGVDQRDGSRFSLEHLREPLQPGEITLDGETVRRADTSWRWQRYLAERVLADKRLVILKGRQIGVTWICLAVDAAEAVTRPGTTSLLYRQREDEAIDNVRRWWVLYQSLPPWFKTGIKVLSPDRVPQPGRDGVRLQFPDGRISDVVPMTSAVASGHGRTVRRVLLDEGAYIDLLEQILAAVEPAAGAGAINLVSTANGRWNPDTDGGNEFHRVYSLDTGGYQRLFFPYDVHPGRDQAWYDTAPEVQSRKVYQRHANFPRNAHEAFALTSRTFIDADDLAHYRTLVRQPSSRLTFEKTGPSQAAVRERSDGFVSVFERPDPDHMYAIGADVATGRGADYSAAYVIDLTSMALVAEAHGKIDADLYAFQLHYLGRWYGTRSGCRHDAWLAVETGGGFGEAVLIPLRDGREGRPAYPRLYRHVLSSRPDLPLSKPFGFPTNSKTRPLILNQLEKAIRERQLPYLSDGLMWELEELVQHEHGPSPRAQEGSRDDRVFAAAIALEMYRLHGSHPDDRRKRSRAKRHRKTMYPWQEELVPR
ncbi:MAG: hypothetical protein HY323_05425 [Betaproteobacteria bacterium]|nr:hypothetical protein [Betaproteobacteria bacterium]